MRVIGTEHPHLRATQIDVDADIEAEQLAQQLICETEEDETAWRNGQLYVARLYPTPLRPEERKPPSPTMSATGCVCTSAHLGISNRRNSLPSSGFRLDPERSRSRSPRPASTSPMCWSHSAVTPPSRGDCREPGTDFAGVVTAVGPDVTEHKVGDHVGGLSPNGCWATFITCDANLAVTLPAGLADADAAAVTTATATAWYGLHDLARIQSGDKVLIHSATGGVGQAAIAIARAAGAEIFATAGSEQRRATIARHGY